MCVTVGVNSLDERAGGERHVRSRVASPTVAACGGTPPVIDDNPDLERKYRSPRAFGPMPGPRNIPLSQRDVPGRPDEVTTSVSVSLEADPAELARLLPPETRLSGVPALTVTATRFENLLWLAGRGYPILTVTFPIEYVGDGETVSGRYLAVLWEGLADPITTGREELGFPKLYADIRAPRIDDVSATGGVDADASWDGFRFLDLTAQDLRAAPPDEAVPPPGTLVHRFVPSLGAPDRADIDHLVYHSRAAGDAKRPTVTHLLRGTGRFSFHHARFADVPVQYPVINTLAALSLGATGPAMLTRTTAAPGSGPGAAVPRLLGRAVGQRTAEVSP